MTLDADDLRDMQGDVSQQAIRIAIHLEPFTSKSVVHDNACGAGAVTEMIMESNPPTGVQIYATDINPDFVAGTKQLSESNNWPVTTGVMDARKLEFEDNMFSHSFTAFAFHCMAGGDTTAKEI